jgi:hypothetical protein
MAGHRLPFRRSVPVRTAEPISLKPRLQHFLRAIVTEGASGPEARLTGPQGSGILTSMAPANALLKVVRSCRRASDADAVTKATTPHCDAPRASSIITGILVGRLTLRFSRPLELLLDDWHQPAISIVTALVRSQRVGGPGVHPAHSRHHIIRPVPPDRVVEPPSRSRARAIR